jgi:hypothetical protein
MKNYKSMCSDKLVVVVMEVLLLSIFLISGLRAVMIYFHQISSSALAVGERSVQSMTFLFTVYGVTTLIYTLAVQAADAFKGNKVLIIILNYVALTYLFFFNPWFRNSILFPLFLRISRDKLL